MEEHVFAYSYLLIILSLLIARREELGNEREILVSSLRTALQLVLLGYLLRYLLQLEDPGEIFSVILFMALVSAIIAYERVRHRRVLLTSFISIAGTTFTALTPLLLSHLLQPTAHQLIPFGGLIIGNTLNSITLAFDRFLAEVRHRREEIEAKVALGARTSLIPKINFMKAAGLVHIPGVAVGMLMAGADPMRAILFQIAILYTLVFTGLAGSVLMLYMSYRQAFLMVSEFRT